MCLLFVYLLIGISCSTVSSDTVISEKCIGKVVKERYCTFNVHGSVHPNNILLCKSQQDAHVTEIILTDNCSTCFGRHYHPSSGAQNNCNYSIW